MIRPFLRITRWSLWTLGLCLYAATFSRALDAPVASTAPAPAPDSSLAFQNVCAALRAVKGVQADFTEAKTLHILSHPLQSTGTLMFSPQHGVYRILKEPVHQELLITRTQVIQKDAQGTIQRMRVQGQPAAQAFVDVFLSFFSGDSRGWDKTFQADFSGTETAWTIALTPRKKSPAAKALRTILLAGHAGVLDEMTLVETNGDTTHTTYTHQQLSHDEAAFAFPTDLTTP